MDNSDGCILGSHNGSQHGTDHIQQACVAIANCLNTVSTYAILGSAACQLLGFRRQTDEIEVVVPKGTVAHVRAQLALDQIHFTVEPRTRYTRANTLPPLPIWIISPPGSFKTAFSADTPTHEMKLHDVSVQLLHPALILNAKCHSIFWSISRATKDSDATDVNFLLQWLARNQEQTTVIRVPNASLAFIDWFISQYGGSEDWERVKFLGYF